LLRNISQRVLIPTPQKSYYWITIPPFAGHAVLCRSDDNDDHDTDDDDADHDNDNIDHSDDDDNNDSDDEDHYDDDNGDYDSDDDDDLVNEAESV